MLSPARINLSISNKLVADWKYVVRLLAILGPMSGISVKDSSEARIIFSILPNRLEIFSATSVPMCEMPSATKSLDKGLSLLSETAPIILEALFSPILSSFVSCSFRRV